MKSYIDNTVFESEQVDLKQCPWSGGYRPHWKLTLKYGGRRATFDYWNNIYNVKPEKLEILSMLLSDATAGTYSIDEFQSEFGYKKMSECLRAYKGCQSTLRKIEQLYNINNNQLFNLANTVNELENAE